MRTIARTWRKQIASVRDTAKFCEVYDSDTGHMIRCTVEDAMRAWERFRPAKLLEDTPGQRWTVHMHSNRWYTLTVRDPEEIRAEQRAAQKERAAARPPLPTAATGRRSSGNAAGPRAPFPPGFDAQTQGAADAIVDRHRKAGLVGSDPLGRSMGPMAATIVAQTVKEKRRQGWSHEQIRTHFQELRAKAAEDGNTLRVAAVDTFLAVHAGMIADLAKLAANGGAQDQQEPAAVEKAPTAALPAPSAACWCGETPCPLPDQHANTQAMREAVNETPQGAPAAAVADLAEQNERPAAAPARAATPTALPPHERGYEPVRGAKPYAVRRTLAALEAAGVPVKGDEVEFWLTVSEHDDVTVNVAVLDIGDAPKEQPEEMPRRKADRRELRRAEVLAALLRGGLTDAVMLRGGVRLKVARQAPRAATLVVLGEMDYSGEKFIDRPVTLPQYPQITGWTLRRRWGKNYIGPMTPWIEHTDGTIVGPRAKDEKQAAEALCNLYGLLRPVRVTTG